MEIDPISKMTVDEKTAKFTSGYCVFFSVISIMGTEKKPVAEQVRVRRSCAKRATRAAIRVGDFIM